MFDGQHSSFRFGARLLILFSLLSLASLWFFEYYAPMVTWGAIKLWYLIGDTEVAFTISQSFPTVIWHASWAQQKVEASISFYLVSYNAILFAAILLAYPGWSWRHRGLLALTGIPFVLGFHIIDLLLSVENRLLTLRNADHYQMLTDFDIWFSFIKYAHSLSVFAGKKIFPVLLLLTQNRLLAK